MSLNEDAEVFRGGAAEIFFDILDIDDGRRSYSGGRSSL